MADEFHDTAALADAIADVAEVTEPPADAPMGTPTEAEGDDSDPPAVIVGGDHAALGVVTALRSYGIEKAIVDVDASGVAWRSDAVDVAGEVRDPATDPDGYRSDLRAIAESVGEVVLFPCSAAAVRATLADVPENVTVPYGDSDVALAVSDTELLYALADQAGVDRPTTYRVVGSDDGPLPAKPPEDAADELGYPLECVPASGTWLAERVGADPFVAEDEDDLATAVAAAETAARTLFARESIDVETDCSLATMFEDAQQHTTAEVRTKVRRGGRHGPACLVDLERDPNEGYLTSEDGLAVLDEAGYSGPATVRLARTPDDRTVLLEASPATPRWLRIVTDSGPNLPYAAYVEACGGDEYVPDPPEECRWVAPADYLRHLATGGEDHLSEDQWLAYLSGRFQYAKGMSAALLPESDLKPTYALFRRELGLV